MEFTHVKVEQSGTNLIAEADLLISPVQPKLSESDQTELRIWSHIKKIPIINTFYGLIRTFVYSFKRNKEEALRSVVNALGGLAGFVVSVAVITVCEGLVLVPVIAAVLAGGAAQQLVAGGGEFAIDFGYDEELKTAFSTKDWDKIESRVYSRITGDMPGIGAVYSLFRGIAYMCKGQNKEASRSGRNLVINASATGIAVGVGYGIAHATTSAWDNSAAYISQASASATMRTTGRVITAVGSTIPQLPIAIRRRPNLNLGSVDAKSFKNCIENFRKLSEGHNDHSRMHKRKQILAHIVKCLCSGVRIERGHLEFTIIKNADPVVVQALLSFWSGDEELYTHLLTMFDTMDTTDFPQRNSWTMAEYIAKVADKRFFVVQTMLPLLIPTSLLASGTLPKMYHYIPTEVPLHRPLSSLRPASPFSTNPIRILTLCGGGTRGLISLELLGKIEQLTGKKIKDSFDYIAGTSTGGLLALYLAQGHSVAKCRKMYFELKDKIFSSPPPHNEILFEKILKQYFPEEMKMSDLKDIKVRVVSATGSIEHPHSHIFSNGENCSDPIWKVARATSAAPGFFKPISINGLTFIDGGLGANNPTNTILTRMTNSDESKLQNATVVSIGTGQYCGSNTNIGVEISGTPFGMMKAIFKGEVKKGVNLFVNVATQSDGDEIEKVLALCKSSRAFFYHLNPTLPEELELNETDDERLLNGMWHGKVFSNVNDKVFEEIANRLGSTQTFNF